MSSDLEIKKSIKEIRKIDPLFAKYYQLFLLIQRQQAEILVKLINKYDEERQVRLMQLISQTAEELAKTRSASLKQQWIEAKEIIKEIVNTLQTTLQPQVQPIAPVYPVSSPEKKPKLEVKIEDLKV